MLRSVLILLLLAGTASAQIDALRAEIRAAYGPDLNLIRARDFFADAKKKPNVAEYVQALRLELEDRSNPSRMRADGTARLISLSDSQENLTFAARTLARTNFREVGIAPYYAVLRQLADRNVDVSLAAFRLLEQPDLRMNWVSDFSFDQASLVASILLSIDEKYWGDGAIERLASEQDETAQRSLIRLLWYLQSDFADAELGRFGDDPKKPTSSRTLALELLAREPVISALDRTEVLTSTEDQLHESRRLRQARLYFKEMMPTLERDTMKILLKRRLSSAEAAN
jgi:hypothetical protein